MVALMCMGCMGQAWADRGSASFSVESPIQKSDLPAFLPMLRWDMSMEQLLSAQLGAPPIVTADTVEFYGVPLLDLEATVVCTFGGVHYERLDWLLVILNDRTVEPQEAYRMLSAALNKQYGEPGSKRREWSTLTSGERTGGASAKVSGAFQEFSYYEGLKFQLSCTLEDWQGEMVASALFQRGVGSAVDYSNTKMKESTFTSRASVFEAVAATPTPTPVPIVSARDARATALPGSALVRSGVRWGMSREEARALEGTQAIEDSEHWLRYSIEQEGGEPYLLAYYFEEDALKRFYLIQQNDFENLNDHIDIFEVISAKITEALGEADDFKVDWVRDAYRGRPEHYGLAVSLGDLRVTEMWVKEDVSITHGLVGEDHEITHYLEYAQPDTAK